MKKNTNMKQLTPIIHYPHKHLAYLAAKRDPEGWKEKRCVDTEVKEPNAPIT